MNKFQWTLKLNSYILIEENACKNVICDMAAILSRPQCFNTCILLCLGTSWFNSYVFHFTCSGAMVHLPQWKLSNPEEYTGNPGEYYNYKIYIIIMPLISQINIKFTQLTFKVCCTVHSCYTMVLHIHTQPWCYAAEASWKTSVSNHSWLYKVINLIIFCVLLHDKDVVVIGNFFHWKCQSPIQVLSNIIIQSNLNQYVSFFSRFRISFARWWPFSLGLNVLNHSIH